MNVHLTNEDVRSVRVMAAQGVKVSLIATLHGINVSRAWRLVNGEARRDAGGPMRRRVKRPLGGRRICIRCKRHKDEPEFAHERANNTGICQRCAEPGDGVRFTHQADREERSKARREREVQARAQLRAEIDRLQCAPLCGEPLGDAERYAIQCEVTRSLRANQRLGFGETRRLWA